MITLQDFISCTFRSQLDIVSDLGISVCQYTDPEQVITLFRLENFFVEVFFNRSKIRITHMHVYPPSALPKFYDDAGVLLSERLPEEGPAESKNPLQNKPPFISNRASYSEDKI